MAKHAEELKKSKYAHFENGHFLVPFAVEMLCVGARGMIFCQGIEKQVTYINWGFELQEVLTPMFDCGNAERDYCSIFGTLDSS